VSDSPALHSKWLLLLKIEIHLEWRAELSDTILKWDYPRTIPAKFGLIWFSGFRREDLNVKVYDVRRMFTISQIGEVVYVLITLSAGRWFSPGTPVSSTNKIDHRYN
jgi:hypothetical protein